MFHATDSLECLLGVEHFVILFVTQRYNNIAMLEPTRRKLEIPDDSRININPYRNPYLTKLTIKILPHYSKIKGPTLISPLQNHNNVAIIQSLPLWRNQKFRIGLLWQQNIRNTFNRTHIGFVTEYQMNKNYVFKSKNLMGSSFLTTNELSKTFAHSGNLFTVSGFHSCFFESSSDYFHTIGAGICVNNRLSLSVNKRMGAETGLRIHYERPLQNGLFLRAKYDTEIEKFDESTAQVGLGYYWSKNSSVWLRTAVQSDRMEPNLAVECQLRRQNNHCFVGSVEYRNEKSVIYLGYKCPSFNFIFPIYGVDSVVPALIAAGAYLIGYFKRCKDEDKNEKKKEQRQKNRYDELKLISDKANQNYQREQTINGLLIQQVYVGQKQLLQHFLSQPNRQIKLTRNPQYANIIFDGTMSFRFYVQRSKLHIPKGNKLTMIGFYYRPEQGKDIGIYVRYMKNGVEHEKMFQENDQIRL